MSDPRFEPEVTVVVATRNRRDFLPDVVECLKGQTHGGFRAVFLDDGSTDDTVAVLEAAFDGDTRFEVRSTSHRGPAAARNAAIRTTRSEWLAFTDDDCLPHPGWLESLLEVADATGAELVQGRTASDPTVPRRDLPWFNRGKDVPSWSGRFQMCNLLVARRRFLEAGGLDETFPPGGFGEDTDLGLRVVRSGAATAFAPDAVVHHRVIVMTYAEFLRRRYRWSKVVHLVAVNPDARATFPHPYVAQRSHIPVWLAVPVAVASVTRRSWWVPAAGLAAYAAHRAAATRWQQRPLTTRLARSPLELVGLVVETAGFAVQSARYRRLLL